MPWNQLLAERRSKLGLVETGGPIEAFATGCASSIVVVSAGWETERKMIAILDSKGRALFKSESPAARMIMEPTRSGLHTRPGDAVTRLHMAR